MHCPFCHHAETQVVETRESDEGGVIRRRRRCLHCGKRFTTYERSEIAMPAVVKKDGARAPFDPAKLRASMLLALHKRSVSVEQVDAAIDRIQDKLLATGAREVASARIGELVMRELKKMIPGIVYDLRYTGSNNFIGRRMYPLKTNQTFLRAPAAEALAKVQAELKSQNLGLKIYDAYRPYSVTVTFWELIKDERYVANPSKGSGHNRGLAVDLTIIDLTTGNELDMGTGFDSFSDSAHHNFTSLPEMIQQNRRLFKEIMTKYGFQLFETEWWHYSWPNDKEYEIMDIPFRKLKKAIDEK